MPKLIERYNNERKSTRRSLIDIVVNSQGTFNIEELVQMPLYYVNEILDSFKDRNEKQQQAIDAASGKNKRTF